MSDKKINPKYVPKGLSESDKKKQKMAIYYPKILI